VKIGVKALTTCSVSPDGETIELNFINSAGDLARLEVPYDMAQAIAMTLPELLTQALQRITGASQARYVFPLGAWSIEASDEPSCVIATLATDDGFRVSFGIPYEAGRGLAWALKHEADSSERAEGVDVDSPLLGEVGPLN